MAQEVKIAGATYSDVPSIEVPDSNGTYHSFVDTSDADATRSDILSGRTAYVNGAKLMGSAVLPTDYLVVDTSSRSTGVANPINADTLDGYDSSHFVATDDVKNMYYGRTNPITSTSGDTTRAWTRLGTGYYYFNTAGYLIDQPSQYGFLINTVLPGHTEVSQIWIQQANAQIYARSGNTNGWGSTWKKVFLGTMTLSGTTLTITSL